MEGLENGRDAHATVVRTNDAGHATDEHNRQGTVHGTWYRANSGQANEQSMNRRLVPLSSMLHNGVALRPQLEENSPTNPSNQRRQFYM